MAGYDLPKARISIHAPHARSDTRPAALQNAVIFQSTLLMRGATMNLLAGIGESVFQSTLLMRGATKSRSKHKGGNAISIHAPHARSDRGQF